jgi:glyoxylate reductase
MKPTIFVTRTIPTAGLDKLHSYFDVTINPENRALSKQELIDNIHDKEALLCLLTDPIDKEVFAAGNKLKVISNYAVGYNNIDVMEAAKRNIPVCITPGILTNATADLTFALILAITRRIVESDQYVRQGFFKSWDPNLFLGIDLAQKTLGIIGMGRIGHAVAKRARGFEMNIIYHSRSEKNIPDARAVSLDELLKTADIISLHTPLTPETHHLIGEAEFAKMKKTVYLINTTRGPVIDEMALLNALKDHKIAGAGLDVYEHEPLITPGLIELENVVLLPHIGSATVETRTKMAVLAAENAIAIMEGKKPHAMVS